MTLHLGLSHNNARNAEQQQEIREARKLLKSRVRNDWDYPALPPYRPTVHQNPAATGPSEEKIAGFKIHEDSAQRETFGQISTVSGLGFEPMDWRERDYSSESGSGVESEATTPSTSPTGLRKKKSRYRFHGPDSVAAQISERKSLGRRTRQKELDAEMRWNDGLAHWIARRDAWCAAHTYAEVHVLDHRRRVERSADSSGLSDASSSRTSTSSAAESASTHSTPATSPELTSSSDNIPAAAAGPLLSGEMLVPVAPTILSNHPVRRKITPSAYPEIYSKIILQSRTPSVPINLHVLTKALVQGWVEDGEWPPKQQQPVEKSVGRRKGGGEHESSLKSGVKAVGRVLRITGNDSHGGHHSRDKG